jgi:uroporphyrin-III C-methyltransferase
MAMRNVVRIVAALSRGGLAPDTPAAAIVSATLPDERIVISRLDRLADDVRKLGFGRPGLIVIGDIVAVRGRLLGASASAEVAR